MRAIVEIKERKDEWGGGVFYNADASASYVPKDDPTSFNFYDISVISDLSHAYKSASEISKKVKEKIQRFYNRHKDDVDSSKTIVTEKNAHT